MGYVAGQRAVTEGEGRSVSTEIVGLEDQVAEAAAIRDGAARADAARGSRTAGTAHGLIDRGRGCPRPWRSSQCHCRSRRRTRCRPWEAGPPMPPMAWLPRNVTLVRVVVEKPAAAMPPPAAGPPAPVAELPPMAWLPIKRLLLTASEAGFITNAAARGEPDKTIYAIVGEATVVIALVAPLGQVAGKCAVGDRRERRRFVKMAPPRD